MTWYVVDALDKAFGRTKKCLFEPFDFWKWMKLVIIVMLIGGAGSNFNGGGNNYSSDGYNLPESGATDSFTDTFRGFIDQIPTDPGMGLIIGIIVLIFILILFFSYVSSVMEFVFVESLVSNDVRFWEYSRRYLRKGLGLFLFRILTGIFLLAVIAIMALPFVLPLIGASGENYADVIASNIISLIFLLIGIILVTAIIGGVISSFINLSIPVAIYTESGIFRAFSNVFRQFRKDWKQIVVYWFGRILLGLVVGIAVAIILLIVMVAVGLFILFVDMLLYLALSALLTGSDAIIWMILVPLILIQTILFILLLAFIALPASVFMKYHMLTFLQQWYTDVEIPVFDMQQINEELY
ncbi:DUF7544 domain-containing protein [Methanococcoides seepicolus]|uniref:Uncharacterized protein n=1 Tax=Methanococcoides seepicolus TaxID=2828780 RepID=A0A9E5DBX2_9EURY|nr:hypothetical protein [Methanococcoides seepicolus]MCM1986589.1 hypothetical protein [Methanococcoides seepicolus]